MSPPQYLDTSVVLAALLGRAGTLPRADLYASSELTRVELMQAVNRLRVQRHLDAKTASRKTDELRAILAQVLLFPIGDEIVTRAEQPFPIPVRAATAIHLATAEVVRLEAPGLELLTDDPELAAAGAHRGFVVRGLPSTRH